jgi:hypothetical protein
MNARKLRVRSLYVTVEHVNIPGDANILHPSCDLTISSEVLRYGDEIQNAVKCLAPHQT